MIHACILAKVRLEIGEDSDLTFDSHFTQPSAFPCYAPQKNIKKVKFIQIILCHSSLLDCWRREQKHWGYLSRRGFFLSIHVNLIPKRHLTILTAKNKNRFSPTEFSQTFKP